MRELFVGLSGFLLVLSLFILTLAGVGVAFGLLVRMAVWASGI